MVELEIWRERNKLDLPDPTGFRSGEAGSSKREDDYNLVIKVNWVEKNI